MRKSWSWLYHDALIIIMFLVVAFFIISPATSADEPPVVTLNSPANQSNFSFGSAVLFNWTVIDEQLIVDCDLLIDDIIVQNDVQSENGTSITASEQLSMGTHNWYVTCIDGGLNEGNSETRTLTVSNDAPYNGTAVIINSTLGLNRTLEDLNVRTTLLDINNHKMNVTVRWFNQSVLHTSQMYNLSYSNGSTFIGILDNRNTTKGHNWTAQITIYDGFTSFHKNSSTLQISDSPPNATLVSPTNNSISPNYTNQLFTFAMGDVDVPEFVTAKYLNFSSLAAYSGCNDINFNGSTLYPILDANENYSMENSAGKFECPSYLWSVQPYSINLGDFATYFRVNFTGVEPNVTLNAPASASTIEYGDDISFNWTSVDYNITRPVVLCNLTIDSVINRTNVNATNATMVNVSVRGFSQGTHTWNVSCVDGFGNRGNSNTRTFEVIDSGDSLVSSGEESESEGNRKEQVTKDYWSEVYDKTSDDLSTYGILQEFKEKEAVKIKVEGEEYTMGPSTINSEKAFFKIDSESSEEYLFHLGDVRSFDLDKDGKNEITVTLLDVNNGVAVFDIKQAVYSSETDAEFYGDIAEKKFKLIVDENSIFVYVVLLIILVTVIIMNKMRVSRSKLKKNAGFKN